MLSRVLALSLVAGIGLSSRPAQAFVSGTDTRVFLLTSTYGVMAGTLTGLASLAFYDDPSEHLRNVAMGASIGLYAGIALGAYLVYAVPTSGSGGGDNSSPAAPATPAPPANSDDPLNLNGSWNPAPAPKLAWQPILGASPKGFVMGFGLRY